MDIIKVENTAEEKRKQLIYELMIGAYVTTKNKWRYQIWLFYSMSMAKAAKRW